MPVTERDREVFRRIGEVESEARPAPASFEEGIAVLKRLLERDRAMFPGREYAPDDGEFAAHESLYARARVLGMHRDR